jgi:hypothetical protein
MSFISSIVIDFEILILISTKYALPVMYLLLKRHFEIFRVCQTRVVSPDELWDAGAQALGCSLTLAHNNQNAGDTLEYVDLLNARLATLQC